MKTVSKYVTLFAVWLRWRYFHMHPNYVKFYAGPEEAHFQHRVSGHIYSNYRWVD